MRHALKDIRASVFARSDAAPDGTTTAVTVANNLINDALQQMALDAPFLFWEEEVRFTVGLDAESASATDLLKVATEGAAFAPDPTSFNPWVLQSQLDTGALVDRVVWPSNGSWNGRMIDIIEPDGTIHTNRIRDVWIETPAGSADDYYMISLWKPMPDNAYADGGGNDSVQWTNLRFRVYDSEYYFPDDVIELKSMRLVGKPYPIEIIAQDEAERIGLVDDQFDSGQGQPRFAYRRGHFQIPSPNVAPDVEAANPDWEGPEPPGEFEYIITYCWGHRSFEHLNPGIRKWNDKTTDPDSGVGRLREPLWESSPSPVSSAITVPDATAPNILPSAVSVKVPNVEYMQGFLLDGTYNHGAGSAGFARVNSEHSGWWVRIWRRRKTATLTNYSVFGTPANSQGITGLANSKLDIQDAFYLLDEFDITIANTGVYIDNGSVIPDYHRRLRNVHGYQAVRFHPRPNAFYEVACRVTRRPQALVSESDAPPIHPEASKPLVDLSLSLWYERLKEPQNAAMSYARYQDGLMALRKRYGDLRAQSEPARKRPARVRGIRDPWRNT
jgi:hypothetical protein